MAWWWVALMLVLVTRHPGNRGLWLWVALVPCLPGVHPCLICFWSTAQRTQVCEDITGTPYDDPKHRDCQDAIVGASLTLASVSVGADQHEELRDIVMDALYFLGQQKNQRSSAANLNGAVDLIWRKVGQLKKVPPCIPPCGLQPDARVFQCTCRFVDCGFPTNCPVQDVWTYTDEAIVLRCEVPFNTPAGLPVTWMFAPNVRTEDLKLFKVVKGNAQNPSRLTIDEPTPGTVSCRLGDDFKPVVRKFFYLNVSEGRVEDEKNMQNQFRNVLFESHNENAGSNTTMLGLVVGISTLAVVLLVVVIWQCVSQRSRRRDQQHTQGDSASQESLLKP